MHCPWSAPVRCDEGNVLTFMDAIKPTLSPKIDRHTGGGGKYIKQKYFLFAHNISVSF
jgi:hypothetical protein